MAAPSSVADLLTPTEFRAEATIPQAVTDDVLADRIERAVARVRTYCRWHLFPEVEETLTAHGVGSYELVLPTMRVTDVSGVRIRGENVADFTWSEDGRLRSPRPFPDGLQAVEVDLTHGYDVDEIADVRDVVMDMVKRAVSLPFGVRDQSAGDVSVSYGIEASLRPTFGDRDVLNEYRIR